MRPTAAVAFLLATAAFILSILILFSGRNPSFLTDVYLTKIDTSGIGANAADVINENTNGFLDRIAGDRLDEFVNGVAQTAANALGVHDAYSVHILNYCAGDETREEVENNRVAGADWCSKQRANWYFDLSETLERDIAGEGTSPSDALEQIGYPREDIDDVSGYIKTIQKAMIVFQIGAAAGTGLTLILSLIGIFIDSRFYAFFVTLVAVISFLFVGLASALGTVVGVKLRDGLRDHLAGLNVYAYISDKYLGMTWAATGAMLLVAVYWMFSTCFHSGRKRRARDREAVPVQKPVGRRRFGFFGRRRY